jgi:hypothetical protein
LGDGETDISSQFEQNMELLSKEGENPEDDYFAKIADMFEQDLMKMMEEEPKYVPSLCFSTSWFSSPFR